MTLQELQNFINIKAKENNLQISLIEDGKAGPKTREAFIKVMTNPKAIAISDSKLREYSLQLGDTDIKRIKAISKVESNGSGWDSTGLLKILYERHKMYSYINKEIVSPTFGLISTKTAGGYTLDTNGNSINDSWEKLSEAICIDVDSAIKSVSVGKFQVMCGYYDILGYNRPIDMLWACTRDESEHYKILVGFILKVSNLKQAFLSISTNPKDCIPFVRGYNGINWEKNDYANKLAIAMRG